MITLQGTELKKQVESAIDKAIGKNAPIIVSEVQRIQYITPISFFSAGKEQFFGERIFWKEPTGQFTIVGLGKCVRLENNGMDDRFIQLENHWHSLIEDAVIIDEFGVSGTGPLMFGGFSFDPLKEKTKLWENYAHTHFQIPKLMLTITNGEAFLTTNVIVTKNDDLRVVENILVEREKLLSKLNQSYPIDSLPSYINYCEVVEENDWKNTVNAVVNELTINNELKKVVLARELRILFQNKIPHDTVLHQLLEQQKDSFIFAFESNDDCFISATPERLVKKLGKRVFSACVAGSIARGKTVEEDEKLGQILLNDEKNLVEHQYVVEMIKEGMESICTEVRLPEKPTLMKIRDIQHLYTPVVGICDQNSSLLKLVERLHPTPALGGFPQKLAVEKIREMEKLDRGLYASPIGWLDHQGNGDFAVAIRSGLIQGKEASLFAGCGIVKDSDAESEYVETKIKFRPMLSALGGIKL